MRRAIVSRKIADEALDHLRGVSTALEKPANIKEVTGMLPIHRGNKLAAVQFRRGEQWHGQLGGEQPAGFPAQVPRDHRQHRAAKDVIHLDLHLHSPASDEQFDFVAVLGR